MQCGDTHELFFLAARGRGAARGSMSIPLAAKREVWLRDVGPRSRGMCVLGCGRAISVPESVRVALKWGAAKIGAPVAHFGHVRARSRGGDCSPANLRAICPECNLSMGPTDMRHFARAGGPRRPPARPPLDLMEVDQAHDPHQCVGVTRSGALCRNRALRGDVYCAVHRGGPRLRVPPPPPG